MRMFAPQNILALVLCVAFGVAPGSKANAAGGSATASTNAPAPASASAPDASAPSRERSRLEELFIWKTSEELTLPPAQEERFTTIIRALNSRRRAASERMDQAVRDLALVKTKPEAEKALKNHRAALHEYQAVQNAELDQLTPLLGALKMARYLVVKNEINEKLKLLLTVPKGTKPVVGATATPGSAASVAPTPTPISVPAPTATPQ